MGKTALMAAPYLVLTIVTVGCATNPNIKYYDPPALSSSETSAAILGSEVRRLFPLDNETTFVLAIDGEPLRKRRGGFNKPILVLSGSHTVQVAFAQGSLFGQASFKLDVRPGAEYMARSQKMDGQFVVSWIEDRRTSVVASEKIVVKIDAPAPSGFFVPILLGK